MGEVTRLAPRAPADLVPRTLSAIDVDFGHGPDLELTEGERSSWEEIAAEIAARRPFTARDRHLLTMDVFLARAWQALVYAREWCDQEERNWIEQQAEALLARRMQIITELRVRD